MCWGYTYFCSSHFPRREGLPPPPSREVMKEEAGLTFLHSPTHCWEGRAWGGLPDCQWFGRRNLVTKQQVSQASLSPQRGQGLHCSKGQSYSVTVLLQAWVASGLLGSLGPCLVSATAELVGTGSNTWGWWRVCLPGWSSSRTYLYWGICTETQEQASVPTSSHPQGLPEARNLACSMGVPGKVNQEAGEPGEGVPNLDWGKGAWAEPWRTTGILDFEQWCGGGRTGQGGVRTNAEAGEDGKPSRMTRAQSIHSRKVWSEPGRGGSRAKPGTPGSALCISPWRQWGGLQRVLGKKWNDHHDILTRLLQQECGLLLPAEDLLGDRTMPGPKRMWSGK